MTKSLATLRTALAAAPALLFAVACSNQSSLSGSLYDETKPDAGECTDCSPPDAAPEPKDCDAAPDAPPPSVCGDGVCDVGEVCEQDCCDHVCGDGMCGTDEECPADCDGECQEECCGDDCPPPPPPPDDETGCTLTQGYWKTHNEYANSPGLMSDWPLPHDEDDLLCDQSLLGILETAPLGDAWYILAHQYIAARLNVASGASTPDEVDSALASAEEWLLANCGGAPASTAPEAIALAETLDRYNHGEIGPGHCD